MKLEIKAKELLDSFHFLSKIARRNENIGKNLLIESDKEEVRLYAQSTDIYGLSILHAGIIEAGSYLLPLSLIPYLQNLGENQIALDIDLDKIKIKFGKSKINLAQISGKIGDFSKRKDSPEWTGVDLSRLKDIRYASGTDFGYDVFWIVNNSIIASNRIKAAIYRPDDLPDARVVIPNYITSFLPDEIIDLGFGKEIWLGNNRNCISTPLRSDGTFPQPLLDLSAEVDFSNFVMAHLPTLMQAVSSAAKIASDRNPGCIVDINDEIVLTTASDSGDTNIHINVLDNSELKGPIKINVDAQYLKQILTNCSGPQVMVGIRSFGKLDLFMVHDYNITHFLVPRAGG